MKKGFKKRIFTSGSFIRELGYVTWHLPKIIRILVLKQHPGNLFEKIIIVTDAVNGCIYCSWFDAKLALKSGISEIEIRNMLNLEFHTDSSEAELPALLFTQHFVEANRHPDPEMVKKLLDVYGEKTARDIMLTVRATSFGNMYFNT